MAIQTRRLMSDQPVFDAGGQITDWLVYLEYDWDNNGTDAWLTAFRCRNDGPYSLRVDATIMQNRPNGGRTVGQTFAGGTGLTTVPISTQTNRRIGGYVNPQNGRLDGIDITYAYV